MQKRSVSGLIRSISVR